MGKLCAYLIEDGHEDRARFLASATPHWFRHTLGNELRGKGYDLATIADAGMWDSIETPKNHYLYQEDPRTETALRERDLTNVGEIGNPKVVQPVSWNK